MYKSNSACRLTEMLKINEKKKETAHNNAVETRIAMQTYAYRIYIIRTTIFIDRFYSDEKVLQMKLLGTLYYNIILNMILMMGNLIILMN